MGASLSQRPHVIANLQVLRGLAALAVVFFHTGYTFNGGVYTQFQAVSVFFVISGFIMTFITRDGASQFLMQRLVRIVPLYWLCTLAPIVLLWLTGGTIWKDPSAENIAKSLLFVPYRDAFGDVVPQLGVGWTLNMEMYFYLIFALALVVSLRWGPLLACAALVAVKLIPANLGCTWLLCEFYARDDIDFLILGVLSYYVWTAIEAHALALRWALVPIAGLSIMAFVLWNAHPPFAAAVQPWFPFPVNYLMPLLLVTTVLLLNSAQIQWRWKIALMLGDASYALYLTHTIVMEFIRVARNRVIGEQFTVLNPEKNAFAMAVMLIICSLIAFVVHYYVEVPMLRILRQAFVRRSSRSDPSTMPPGSGQAGSAGNTIVIPEVCS
jgi:exopolysaccharide production protein ExoZ